MCLYFIKEVFCSRDKFLGAGLVGAGLGAAGAGTGAGAWTGTAGWPEAAPKLLLFPKSYSSWN